MKMYHLDLLRSLESTSIKPRIGKTGDYKTYYTEDDLNFYNKHASSILHLFQ